MSLRDILEHFEGYVLTENTIKAILREYYSKKIDIILDEYRHE